MTTLQLVDYLIVNPAMSASGRVRQLSEKWA
jgi:hypothetical protein